MAAWPAATPSPEIDKDKQAFPSRAGGTAAGCSEEDMEGGRCTMLQALFMVDSSEPEPRLAKRPAGGLDIPPPILPIDQQQALNSTEQGKRASRPDQLGPKRHIQASSPTSGSGRLVLTHLM